MQPEQLLTCPSRRLSSRHLLQFERRSAETEEDEGDEGRDNDQGSEGDGELSDKEECLQKKKEKDEARQKKCSSWFDLHGGIAVYLLGGSATWKWMKKQSDLPY